MRTPPGGQTAASVDDQAAYLLRTQRVMLWVRGGAALFAYLQVLAYSAEPYPPGHRTAALWAATGFVLVDAAVALRLPRTHGLRAARALTLASLCGDIVCAGAIVLAYSFDAGSAHWAIFFVLPLEGAATFGLGGALGTWAAVAAIYVARELYRAAEFDAAFTPDSVTFRMGLVLLVATIAGLLARDLTRQRERTAAALADLERVDRLRGRLVSALAHDIRSPLAVIRGSLQALQRESVSPEDRVTLLTLAVRQTRRMERLSADLLDLARLEEGRLVIDTAPVALRGLVDEVMVDMGAAEDVTVDVPDDVKVEGDDGRLAQVLANLVGNALVHGQPPVEVRAWADGEDVTLEVRDHGKGVPAAQIASMFQPFAAGKDDGGVGYGLWIVGALVDAHAGTVRYSSGDDGGAVFTLTLPRAGG